MSLSLGAVPGFSDLSDSVLVANDPSRGIHVEEIAANAAFGMVRTEVFAGMYFHGDVIPLPASGHDGYIYERSELIYLYNPALSTNKDSGWIVIGSGSLWFCNWFVDQDTGEVSSLEWYRNSGSGGTRTETNDGQILVYTIAQRQRQNIFMSAVPTFATISPTDCGVDKPWTQSLAQGLNHNAKFCVTNHEIFYCGEYTNGQVVGTSSMISPADGYTYGYSETKFLPFWRWTTQGSSFVEPPEIYSQLGPFSCSVDSTGHVTTLVKAVDNDGNLQTCTGYGRIAVLAFCTRSATPATAPLADDFSDLDQAFFMPGSSLRASNVLKIKQNIDEAILTPEFFGPTVYQDGDTVALPTSPVDGYPYARDEITVIWSYTVVDPGGGSHCRIPVFYGSVDQATGAVDLHAWRLPPGGPYVDDDDTHMRITAVIMACRQQAAPATLDNGAGNPPSDVATSTVGNEQVADVTIPSTTRGDFSLAHGLGVTPSYAFIQSTANGIIRFQTTRYDATNVYLNASADGLTGHVIVVYVT
jgi:hypothetical protein